MSEPIDDLTFAVACALIAKQQTQTLVSETSAGTYDARDPRGGGSGGAAAADPSSVAAPAPPPATNYDFVTVLRDIAMQLHCHEGALMERLALERMRDYMRPGVPDARHHIFLLLRRHAPEQVPGLAERLNGMSTSQLLDVLVLLDEAFGGSVAAASTVGDGFREVLLRNAVLERENAELSMQLKAMQAKPKAQQNEAAFLVADLQAKLYESLGTLARIKADLGKARTAARTVGCTTELDGHALAEQQRMLAEAQQRAAAQAAAADQPPRCGHEPQIRQLEDKLREATRRELAAQQDLLTRMAQVAAMVKSDREKQDSAANLVEVRSGGTQTDVDQRLVRLMQERQMLLERLAAATESLRPPPQSSGALPQRRG
jgi:hypothetical protein